MIASTQPVISENEVTATNGKLRLLSLYGDIPASVRARWVANKIAKLAGPHWPTTSEMWKIDTLQVSEPIRQMITNDAANADVIIIAASSSAHSEPALMEWLVSLEVRKDNHPASGLLVGLLDDDETQTAELSSVVKPLLDCAQQMGWNFIWHRMGEGAMNDASWLTASMENLLAGKLAAANELVFC